TPAYPHTPHPRPWPPPASERAPTTDARERSLPAPENAPPSPAPAWLAPAATTTRPGAHSAPHSAPPPAGPAGTPAAAGHSPTPAGPTSPPSTTSPSPPPPQTPRRGAPPCPATQTHPAGGGVASTSLPVRCPPTRGVGTEQWRSGLAGKGPKARKQDKACHLLPISLAIISSNPFSLQELAIHLKDGSTHLCWSQTSTQ